MRPFTPSQGQTGSVTETIVSDWLKNTNLEDVLKDSSSLSDIEVVKGDATMSGSGESLSWDTKGGDVYYQGKSTDALPWVSASRIYWTARRSPRRIWRARAES